MTINEIIENVKSICVKNGVSHLYLFGSHAKGTAHSKSDVDFVIKGVPNYDKLSEMVNDIPTLRRIDLFNYDDIKNPILKESMDKYGKLIY
jgi:predicted nucleotidyltransferase